ncbi:MAG: hypothetical protein ABIO02_02675, partial [Patescibacteria group bacterium]
PYQVGQAIFDSVLLDLINQHSKAAGDVQDTHLLFTHEPTLYGLLSFLTEEYNLPHVDYVDSIKFEIYSDHILLFKDHELLTRIEYEQ